MTNGREATLPPSTRALSRALRRVIVTITVVLAAGSTFSAILGHGEVAIVFALGAPLGVSAWGFARAGQDEAAAVLLLIVVLTVATLVLVTSSLGLHDTAVVAFAGALAVSAPFVSRRTFLGLAVVALGAGTLVFVLETMGRTRSMLSWLVDWAMLVEFLVITAVTGGLARVVAESLLGSLAVAEAAATVDPVTGLANRASFLAHAAEVLRPGENAPASAVLVLADLDDFRRVNTVVGHAAADRLLMDAAARLATLDKGALVARVGDDEFALLLAGAADADAARYLGQRVASALDFQSAGVPLHATVGVARFPEDAPKIEALLQAAAARLAAAKHERPAGPERLVRH